MEEDLVELLVSRPAACALWPEQTEGPYHRDAAPERTDITEDRPGVPLRLGLRLLAGHAGTPLAGVLVEVWHADHEGRYSGFQPFQAHPGQVVTSESVPREIVAPGETFLRGAHASAVELLRSIPGVETRIAQVIVAEVGTDMSVFATARHLASWAGQCPGNHESAGKRRSGRTRRGSKWLNDALKDAAMAAVRTMTATWRPNTDGCAPASATAAHSVRSSTRSSAPAGTC